MLTIVGAILICVGAVIIYVDQLRKSQPKKEEPEIEEKQTDIQTSTHLFDKETDDEP